MQMVCRRVEYVTTARLICPQESDRIQQEVLSTAEPCSAVFYAKWYNGFMNKIYLASIVSVITIVAVTVYFFLYGKTLSNQSPVSPTSVHSDIASQTSWDTYANTAYRYSIKYPQTWHVGQVYEEDRAPVEKSQSIIIERYGGNGYVGITAWDPSMLDNASDAGSVAFRKTLTVPLQSFSEAARQKEISDQGHVLPNRNVSDLQQIIFAGQKAFSYTVTGSYNGHGGTSANYVFLENNGIKYMIYYSLDVGLAQEIASTFAWLP